MPTFLYDHVSVKAGSESEADTKLKALLVIAEKLSGPELAALAHTVKHDPVKTRIAKSYLGF
jgi:hypothetical protein